MILLALILIGYLVGAIPSGLVLSTYYTEVDLRSGGSGNIGATNVFRLTGRTLGAITLASDLLKGAIMVWLAEALLGPEAPIQVGMVAMAAFLGHCYSIYLDFQGGKGVATAAGIFLALAPLAGLLASTIWVLTFLRWKRSSIGALAAASSLPIWILVFPSYREHIWLSLALTGVLVWRHRENIDRLMTGREPVTTELPNDPFQRAPPTPSTPEPPPPTYGGNVIQLPLRAATKEEEEEEESPQEKPAPPLGIPPKPLRIFEEAPITDAPEQDEAPKADAPPETEDEPNHR